jgi:hypothetical protein
LAAITNASAVAANATAERMLFVSFSIRGAGFSPRPSMCGPTARSSGGYARRPLSRPGP